MPRTRTPSLPHFAARSRTRASEGSSGAKGASARRSSTGSERRLHPSTFTGACCDESARHSPAGRADDRLLLETDAQPPLHLPRFARPLLHGPALVPISGASPSSGRLSSVGSLRVVWPDLRRPTPAGRGLPSQLAVVSRAAAGWAHQYRSLSL